MLRGTEEDLKQHCCDGQGFHVPKRLLKHSAWSVKLLAVCLFSSSSWASKGDVRIPAKWEATQTAGREPSPFQRGVPTILVCGAMVAPGFGDLGLRSVSSRPNPFSLLSLKARNGVYGTAPHRAWLAAGAACASVCSALSHTQNLISAVPQATA